MKKTTINNQSDSLDELFSNDERLDTLARASVQDALRQHKQRGQSVVVWQNGQIVTLAPEDIPVDIVQHE